MRAEHGDDGIGAVYILGVALAPAVERHDGMRLEELVYRTSRAALDDATVSQRQLDNLTLGACDELDGRPISSMLLAAPAGGFQTDEIRVSDSGASAFCLATARHLSGDFDLGVVASWCKPSKTDVASVMNMRCDPFFVRDIGMDASMAEGLFAQGVTEEFDLTEQELAERVTAAYRRAARNPRGAGWPEPSHEAVVSSGYDAAPVRSAHTARYTDGAAALVLASGRWLARNPGHRPLARVSGVGWSNDSYRLDRARLRGLGAARSSWSSAMAMAGAAAPDVVELEAPTVFHEAALVRAWELGDAVVSPSGGSFAQNPLTATGLVNIVEAALQVSGRAGAVQVPDARRAVAHGSHGFAHQGAVVAVLDHVADGSTVRGGTTS